MDKVEEFIKRRWRVDSNFTNGNCYWFAKILCDRFEELKIVYLSVHGHFMASNGVYLYDWNGKHSADDYQYISLEDIKQTDYLWYSRLVRDCIL